MNALCLGGEERRRKSKEMERKRWRKKDEERKRVRDVEIQGRKRIVFE